MSVQDAFEAFMADTEKLHAAIDSSTKASWGGSGYSVELFDQGTYRVLWNNDIGNLYESPGMILSIPPLSDEEWDEDETLRYYDNAEKDLLECFQQSLTVC